jgi:hypothetical protein
VVRGAFPFPVRAVNRLQGPRGVLLQGRCDALKRVGALRSQPQHLYGARRAALVGQGAGHAQNTRDVSHVVGRPLGATDSVCWSARWRQEPERVLGAWLAAPTPQNAPMS